MRANTRQLVTMAVFGALWGMVEISLGAFLKSANVPLSGVVLASLGTVILCAGRQFVPMRGASLFIGVVAMLLKLFSLGGVVVGPMIGILFESVVVELVFSLSPRPSRILCLLAGLAAALSTVAQPFVTGPILWGRDFLAVWADMVRSGSRLLGLEPSAVYVVLAAYLGLHAILGLFAGWMGWDVGRMLRSRHAGQLEV